MNQPFWKRFQNDEKARESYLLKVRILRLIRDFFTQKGFLEFEAPILQPALIPESYLDVFSTEERRVGLEGKESRPLYLLTSPESFSKKMLVAGFGSNFALTKSFRNGEALSGKHMSEFSLLEWYEKGKNYEDVMRTTEELFRFIAADIRPDNQEILEYNSQKISINAPWKRMSISSLFKHFLSIDLEETWDKTSRAFSVKLLAEKIRHLPISVDEKTTWEELFHQLLLTYIEPYLPQDVPVIVYDYPHELSPLAKPKKGETIDEYIWAERFEVMIAGLEICNTFTENTDADLQVKTFEAEIASIEAKGKKSYEFDYDFINALREGIPECSGNALGIDRMVMLFGNISDITVFDFTR
jgi:elongation factor P--beta-lysine ligase